MRRGADSRRLLLSLDGSRGASEPKIPGPAQGASVSLKIWLPFDAPT